MMLRVLITALQVDYIELTPEHMLIHRAIVLYCDSVPFGRAGFNGVSI